MYLDTMQEIYGNVTKVVVESKQGSSLLYLPLDKVMQAAGAGNANTAPVAVTPATAPASPPVTIISNDARSREASRTRDRETR